VVRDTAPTSHESRGQHKGRYDSSWLFLRTMRYSLRRALSLDSVDGCTHNPKVGGSNPPPATNLILLNHQGQRVFGWPFFLFIPCISVQNSPNFVCNSALVCRDCVCVAHRGLRFGMP
jgi:hypothetical protein